VTGVWVGLAFTAVNLVILGLNLKLYTEVFKQAAQQARVK
jgi:hypothetical protein